MPSSHLILSHPLLLLLPIPPSIRVFSNESALCMRWPKYWSFSFSIIPSKEHPGLISFRMDWLYLLAVQGTLKSLLQHHSSKASIFWKICAISSKISWFEIWNSLSAKGFWYICTSDYKASYVKICILSTFIMTARISNQSILKEISPGCSLEGMMLKLKLQYFGHLMQRADSLEKTLMLGGIGGRRRRGDQGWYGWMASPTWWTWVWVNFGSWWWTGVLRFMGLQWIRHNWATELNWPWSLLGQLPIPTFLHSSFWALYCSFFWNVLLCHLILPKFLFLILFI